MRSARATALQLLPTRSRLAFSPLTERAASSGWRSASARARVFPSRECKWRTLPRVVYLRAPVYLRPCICAAGEAAPLLTPVEGLTVGAAGVMSEPDVFSGGVLGGSGESLVLPRRVLSLVKRTTGATLLLGLTELPGAVTPVPAPVLVLPPVLAFVDSVCCVVGRMSTMRLLLPLVVPATGAGGRGALARTPGWMPPWVRVGSNPVTWAVPEGVGSPPPVRTTPIC